jgi:ParB-like chromosome segregation protein Spo0J
VQTATLPLTDIVADSEFQPRVAGIDPAHVRELEEVASYWPPLTVARRGQRYVLVDGFHRYAAAKHLNLASVPALVLDVPEGDDLHARAFALNAAHGRPLTLSDRRAHAARLLKAHPEWADREIGRRSGLVQPTVAKVRAELESSSAIPTVKARVGADGRTRAVKEQEPSPGAPLTSVLADVISALDPSPQRRIVRYLVKLAAALEEQDSLKGFETFEDAAQACRSVLGEERARDLATRLGWSAHNIFEIALALGCRLESAQ